MRGTWRIAKIFGIDVNIDSSWLIVFVLITWTLAGSYFPDQYPDWDSWLHWTVGVTTSVLFFASVLAHELALHLCPDKPAGVPLKVDVPELDDYILRPPGTVATAKIRLPVMPVDVRVVNKM